MPNEGGLQVLEPLLALSESVSYCEAAAGSAGGSGYWLGHLAKRWTKCSCVCREVRVRHSKGGQQQQATTAHH